MEKMTGVTFTASGHSPPPGLGLDYFVVLTGDGLAPPADVVVGEILA